MFASLPLTALRTFESAARLRSFKAAAQELAVTPTAVSHQIKSLERRLGVLLFKRHPRGVRVTAEGERLFEGLHAALLDIADVIDALRPQLSSAALLVTATHSFAALWLIPRLGRFHEAHPGINVRLDTSPTLVDLHRDAAVDVAIRYGTGDYPGLYEGGRLDESFGVYGAPGLVSSRKRSPGALISVHWQNSSLYEEGWRRWCASAGVRWLDEGVDVRAYAEEYYALQAAIAGQGLLLGSTVLVSDSVTNALLLPYRAEIRIHGATYTTLCVPGRERHPPVRAFLDWLDKEFRSEA